MTLGAAMAVALAMAGALSAQHQTAPPHERHEPGQHHPGKHDMDKRGHRAMGFAQDRAQHTFTDRADGGVIQVEAKTASDTVTIGQIRSHLQDIARLFKSGDFEKPRFIHDGMPPGADVMKSRAADITYTYEETPRGGRVRIVSEDAEAIAAIHSFLAFQRTEHK